MYKNIILVIMHIKVEVRDTTWLLFSQNAQLEYEGHKVNHKLMRERRRPINTDVHNVPLNHPHIVTELYSLQKYSLFLFSSLLPTKEDKT